MLRMMLPLVSVLVMLCTMFYMQTLVAWYTVSTAVTGSLAERVLAMCECVVTVVSISLLYALAP